MSIKYDFSGRTVVVTGATRGIGRAMAEAYAGAGATVIATGTTSEAADTLNRAADADGRQRPTFVQANFNDAASTESFARFLAELPRLDVLVNNAGINKIAFATAVDTSDYQAIMNVNLHAPFRLCQAAVQRMSEAQYGRILNVASIWSVISKPGRSVYATTKTGLIGLTRTLAAEVASCGVLVNALSPGFTMTELTKSTLSTDEIRTLADQIPMKRLAAPREIAEVALFLTSEANSYLTGQNIVVDGGFVHV